MIVNGVLLGARHGRGLQHDVDGVANGVGVILDLNPGAMQPAVVVAAGQAK
jgi:hypothetical protein